MCTLLPALLSKFRVNCLFHRTYTQLHSILSGRVEAVQPLQITEYLNARKDLFKNISEPFGKPSDASRKKLNSGSVTLPDAVVVQVDEVDKEFVLAVSEKFSVDEIQALILFRGFLYNEGLTSAADGTSTAAMVAELLEAIAPFYHSERLAFYRCWIPLFRVFDAPDSLIHDAVTKFLNDIIPVPQAFAQSIIAEFRRKTQNKPPEATSGNPKAATDWAKQNSKEQLVLSEALFWAMWGFVPCSGILVVEIYEAAYDTKLCAQQANATLLLDDEATQLRRDCGAIWVLIMIEVLELETMAQSLPEISADPIQKDLYVASPDSLKRIHELVTNNSDSQYVCVYLAWAFVLSRLAIKAEETKEIPKSYVPFFESILPSLGASSSKQREPVHDSMVTLCLRPEAQLFETMRMFLEQSPLFVTAAAWKMGSSVTDTNAIAFRSIFKGM